jgi:ubiquinone/menaquinone biosynthesis C-methylase UbiE
VTLLPAQVSYGPGIVDEGELRLCGDVSGRRAMELGLSPGRSNALVLAAAGAKAIVIDPSPDRIAETRKLADEAEVRIEFHEGDLGDLGFATSASIDVVLCTHRLGEVDDLSRVLRQVHRVLRPDGPFIISLVHPAMAMLGDEPTTVPEPPVIQRRYGEGQRTIGELFMALQRSNFQVDVLHELRPTADPAAVVPTTLVLRARKLGV